MSTALAWQPSELQQIQGRLQLIESNSGARHVLLKRLYSCFWELNLSLPVFKFFDKEFDRGILPRCSELTP